MKTPRTHDFSTHLPALTLAVQLTEGSVLEIGTGIFSTFILHDMLAFTKRLLMSVDDSEKWLNGLRDSMGNGFHEFKHVKDIKRLFEVIGKEWDVVLIDCNAWKDRLFCLKELLPTAKVVILHDYGDEYSNSQWEVHGMFFEDVKETVEGAKYKIIFSAQVPFTVILSNFVDVKQKIKEAISWQSQVVQI